MKAYKKKYEFKWAENYAIFKLGGILNLGRDVYVIGQKKKFLWFWSSWEDTEVGRYKYFNEAVKQLEIMVGRKKPLKNFASVQGSENITIIQNS